MAKETTVQQAAVQFLTKHHGIAERAARKVGCNVGYFMKMINDGNIRPPTHILNRLGIRREIRYYVIASENAQALPRTDDIHGDSAPVLRDRILSVRETDLLFSPTDWPQSMDNKS